MTQYHLKSVGFGTRPEVIQPSLLEFLKKQVPGAKFVLSTCTGSWALAQAGVLNGKQATSNKALFEEIKVRSLLSVAHTYT